MPLLTRLWLVNALGRRLIFRILRYAKPLAIFWAMVILALSITPGEELPDVQFWEFDKFAHIGVYGLLTFLAAATRQEQFSSPVSRSSIGVRVWIVIVLYGVLIECVQGAWIPGRHFDVLDIMANIIGSILGLFAYIILLDKPIWSNE